jgi:hypothetical protein
VLIYLVVLNVSAGSPSDGWTVSIVGKAAIPIAGFTVAPGYGSDGASLQMGRSFGVIYGWGVKACVQQKIASCN